MKKPPLCKDCKQEVRQEEIDLHGQDERYAGLCTDCRMEKEGQGVIEAMRFDFPAIADYTVIEGAAPDSPAYVEILDKDDKRIGTINERQLDRYWDMMEGG